MPARYQSKAELMPGAEKYMPGYGKTSSYGNSGQGSPLLNLAQSWQDAQDKANKANDDRYNNIVAGYQDNYNQAIQALDKSGAMQRADVGEVYNNRASDVKASAVSRGLSNTTVRDTMLSGNEKERLKAMNRVEEQLNNQRLGYQTSLKNALLQFMERRDDNAPDFGQLLQMAQLMGAGGVGGNQALQYQGGGGFAGGGGGGGGQPYAGGGAQFAGMGGGYGGPNGFGNWGGGGGYGGGGGGGGRGGRGGGGGGRGGRGGGGGGQGNQGLNLAQQQRAQQNQQKQDQQLWNWMNGGGNQGGGGTAGGSSWYPTSPKLATWQAAGELGQQWGPMPSADWFAGQWDRNGNPIGQMSNEQFDQSMNDAYFGGGMSNEQFDQSMNDAYFGGGGNYDVPAYNGYYGTEQPVYGYDNGGGSGYYGTPDEYYYY